MISGDIAIITLCYYTFREQQYESFDISYIILYCLKGSNEKIKENIR